MNERRIARFLRDEVPKGKTDWDRLRALTDEEVEAAAASDPDCPPLSLLELSQAQPVRPEDRAKVPVYIRLDPEVLEYFKAGGPGYQTRINAALREHVDRALEPHQRLVED